LVWRVSSLEAYESGAGGRHLYYVLEDEGGGKVEMSVVLIDGEVDHVLITTSRGSYIFRKTDAEEFLRFVESELLGTKLPESPVQEDEVDQP
jgi:hypothetical protein